MSATARACHPGDRVLFPSTAGEVPATVREMIADPAGWVVYVVGPDAGGR